MGNVISFPTNNEQGWKKTSSMLKGLLIERGMPELEANQFVDDFKPTFDSFEFGFPFSISVSNPNDAENVRLELERFQAALQEHTSKLMMNRFAREVEIYCEKL